jgi:hypothetical protein
MTMQVGMVGTDGVLLASDTLWQNTESNQFSDSRDTTHGTKIEKNYRDGIAVACARNMELASQIAKDLISEMGSDDWESPETHVLQIANKVLERAVEQRREFQCTIITTKAQRQIFKLHAGMSALHKGAQFQRCNPTIVAGTIWQCCEAAQPTVPHYAPVFSREKHRRRFRRCGKGVAVAPNTGNVHTPTMTLKNAALLALIGTILMTALLVWNSVLVADLCVWFLNRGGVLFRVPSSAEGVILARTALGA